MPVQKPPPAVAVALGVLAVVLGIGGVFALRSASSPMPIRDSAPVTSQYPTASTAGALPTTSGQPVGVPAPAWQTLELIDAGKWPGLAAPGTEGGDTWYDRGGALPRTDVAGKSIRYREWDVNAKQPGHSRDAERIVTGSDGSAWYTGNHYRTFTRMR